MEQKIKKITWSVGIYAIVLLVLLMPLARWAEAADKTWTGSAGDGLWSSDSNWNPTGVPIAGQYVFLSAPSTSVQYDYTLNHTLGTLDIGAGITFDHSANTLTIGGEDSLLYVNDATYNLAKTGVLSKENYEVKIGTVGTGYFNQTGGTFEFSGALYLGDQATGHGIYTMTDGAIVAGPTGAGGIVLGEWGGKGEFLQSGGTVTIADLTLARQSGSTGIYTLSGDPSSVTLTVDGPVVVGGLGNGTFTQTGGTHMAGDLILADNLGSNGTYKLSDTGELYTKNLFVGSSGTGLFDHSSGKVVVANELIVGRFGGSNGTYNLSGTGELYAAREIVGDAGSTLSSSGTFNQSGDSIHVIYNDLIIGQDSNSTGIFTLADNAQLTVQGNLYLGDEGGYGQFNQYDSSNLEVGGSLVIGTNSESSSNNASIGIYKQSGGSTIVVNDLILGKYEGTTGTYNLEGGDLTVNGSGTFVGFFGTGVFNQTGGSHTTNGLVLGQWAGSSGAYNLSGDGSYLSIVNDLYIGVEGTGSFIQNDASTVEANNLWLGTAGGSGSYELNGGSLSLAGTTNIGYSGTGTFTQAGGTHTIAGNLTLGETTSGTGKYYLNSGDLNVGGWTIIGNDGKGYFYQKSGNFTLTGGSSDLYLGSNGGSYGEYIMSDGNLSAGWLYVGWNGEGRFNQSGGTVTVYNAMYNAGEMNVGTATGSVGTYNLSGTGNLDASKVTLYLGHEAGSTGVFNQSGGTLKADWMDVGHKGIGTFNQSGGTTTVNNTLAIGRESGSKGEYYLSGNSSVQLQTGDTVVGAFGNGKFTQDGGSHTTQKLALGYNTGGTGTYNLNGGNLYSSIEQRIGIEGTGVFIQSAGTNTVGGTLYIGTASAGTGKYEMLGGTLTAENIRNRTLGTFITGAGTTTTVNNLFTNYGLVSGAGIIAGNFTNYGTVAPGSSPGTMTINGNYTQAGGILEIELGGKDAGNYDVLSINGTADLAGTLRLLLFGTSYTPTGGDSFDVLFAKAITGGFTIDGSGTGWNWNVAYLDLVGGDGFLDTVRLTAAAPVPVPPSVWLLGSGLLGLFGLRRRFANYLNK